ncbi:MAG: sugar ABC transporter substrate-binding protein, partial [Parvibaculaceae bacterium]
MIRKWLVAAALVTGLSSPAFAETVNILMEGVPDTEYVKTLLPEFKQATGIDVDLEVVNYAE